MSLRTVLVSAAFAVAALGASAAWAGGGCYSAACYRRVVQPPVYGMAAEGVVLQPPQVLARTVPGEYASVAEKVLVSPPRKVWQVKRDAYGREIGCWVTVPAQYAVQHRQVMVSPPQVVQETMPGIYGTVYSRVLVQPARSSWVPIGGHGGYVGVGYGGYSAGLGM